MATAVMATTAGGVRQVSPCETGERRALARAPDEQKAEHDHQSRHQLRHHAGAGKRQRPDRQIATEREHDDPERHEDAAGDVIGADDQALSFPFPPRIARLGVVRGEGARDAAQMVCTIRRAIGL